MEEMIEQLIARTGIDRATAEKVVDFVKEHAADIPRWIGQSGLADRLPGNLGDTLGGLLK